MTDLEQLARIIRAHSVNKNGQCSCGETIKRFKNSHALSRHLAQAIIDAGWTPPVEPSPTTCADCGEPLTGDKYTGNWVMKKPRGEHWQHIHRARCPILDRPLNPYLDN